MKFKGMKQAGFSLVELMVVVGIIGILAAIAVPKLQVFTAKAKQSEAKALLKTVYTHQEAWIAENGTPSNNLTTLGFIQTGKTYDVANPVAGNNSAWNATASLKANTNLCAGVNVDNWTINESANLTGTSNPACK